MVFVGLASDRFSCQSARLVALTGLATDIFWSSILLFVRLIVFAGPAWHVTVCLPVLLVASLSLLCCRTSKRSRHGLPWWAQHWSSHGSLLVQPCGLVRDCSPAGWPWTSTSMPYTSFNWWSSSMASSASFSSSPCGWRTRLRPTLTDHLYSMDLSTAVPTFGEQWPLILNTCDPLSVPSSLIVDGFKVTVLDYLFFFSFLLSLSTSAAGGQLSSLQHALVAGSCLPLVLLSQYLPSRVHYTVWLVLWLVTVPQGPCQ